MEPNTQRTNPNRRAYTRFKLDTAVTIIANTGQASPTVLRELSARGIGIVSNRMLNINEMVTVVVDNSCLPQPINRQAKVVWCRQIDNNLWRTGLDFGMDNLLNI